MKKTLCLSLLILLLLAPAAPILADNQDRSPWGIYVGLIGGSSMVDDIQATFDVPSSPANAFSADFRMKAGYLAGIKAGWRPAFAKRILAMELEYNHLTNNMENWSVYNGFISNITLDGKTSLDLFMFNLLARSPQGRFHPYIGLGAGYATFKTDEITAYGQTITNIGGGNGSAMAYQITGGVEFDITRHFIIGFGYKYIYAPKVNMDCTVNTLPAQATMDYASHNFLLSAVFTF